ncbi:MAG: hypothetical protein JWM31_360, partial [Solirubrobacterales bacterium]|nr:hypothetical protein [Solirubrobacterales bacterium]
MIRSSLPYEEQWCRPMGAVKILWLHFRETQGR